MKDILLVGIGGFIGSVARYKLGGLVLHLAAQPRFPVSRSRLKPLLQVHGIFRCHAPIRP